MALRALLVLALTSVLAGPLSARPVPTGAEQRVTRPGPPRRPHLVYVPPTETGEITFLGILFRIEVGEQYDLVDATGYVGRVIVVGVEQTDEQCRGYFYQQARVRMLASSRVVNGNVMAIGPSADPLRQARLIGESESRIAPPHPGMGASLMSLADFDGDGLADLARYMFGCDTGLGVASTGGPICVEDWHRLGESWRLSAQTTLRCPEE